MTATVTDLKTGLPIIGETPDQYKAIVPIDPALLPELREKVGKAAGIAQQSIPVALGLMQVLAQATSLGLAGMQAQKQLGEFLDKVLPMHGIEPKDLRNVELSEWLDLEKGQIKVPK